MWKCSLHIACVNVLACELVTRLLRRAQLSSASLTAEEIPRAASSQLPGAGSAQVDKSSLGFLELSPPPAPAQAPLAPTWTQWLLDRKYIVTVFTF